jgi:hypothetical protein
MIELETSEEGVRGRAYVRCYSPTVLRPVVEMARGLAPFVRGRDLAPADLWTDLRQRFRLLGCGWRSTSSTWPSGSVRLARFTSGSSTLVASASG